MREGGRDEWTNGWMDRWMLLLFILQVIPIANNKYVYKFLASLHFGLCIVQYFSYHFNELAGIYDLQVRESQTSISYGIIWAIEISHCQMPFFSVLDKKLMR
jgi:hypothetical protein